MTGRRVMALLALAALGAGAYACIVPSEAGRDLRVEFTRAPTVLFPGDTFQLEAAVYDGAGNLVEGLELGFLHCTLVPPVIGECPIVEGCGSPSNITYTPCEPSTSVEIDSRTGVGQAVRPGFAGIVAYAPGWPDAARVADTVEVLAGIGAGIESYGPPEVRFGSTVTIVGDELDPDSLEAILVGGVTYDLADIQRFSRGQDGAADTLVLWVLPPAALDANVVLVRNSGLTAVLPIQIEQQDILEPNSFTSPTPLPDSFWNPGLALEASSPVDWYRVEVPNASAVTVTVKTDGTHPQLTVKRTGTESSLVVGSPEFQCLGRTWSTGVAVPGSDLLRVALDFDSSEVLTIGIEHATPNTLVPYALTIEPTYVSALQADGAEGNDFCEDAHELPSAGTTLTLNFDNHPDFDWFRLPVDGLSRTTVTAVSSGPDLQPLVYLFAEETADSVPLATAVGAQPLEQLLGAGSYLLLVASPGGDEAAGGLEYELEVTSSPVEITAVEITEDSIVIAEGEDGRLAVNVFDGDGGTVSGVPLTVRSTKANIEAEYDGGDVLLVSGTWSAEGSTAWVRVGVPNVPGIADSVLVRVTLAKPMLAVWGFPNGEVFVSQGIENLNALLRFADGAGNTVGAFGCNVGRCGNPVFGLWGTDPSNLWGIGFFRDASWAGEPGLAEYFRWNGTEWTWDYVGSEANLYAIWGAGPADIWAVGGSGTAGPQSQIRHFDGETFTGVAGLLATGDLRGVWGTASDDVWAVGGAGYAPAVVHYDGTLWSEVSPIPGAGELRGVWGSAADDVWAVGRAGLLLHWDGTTWTPAESGTARDLRGVFGTGPADVWAVGSGVVLHYDGATWSQVSTGIDGLSLNAVWAGSPDDVWVVGENGLVLHFDGVSWKRLGWDQ